MDFFRDLDQRDSPEMQSVSAGQFILRLTSCLTGLIMLVSTAGLSEDLVRPAPLEPYFVQPGDRVLVALSGGTHFAYETGVTPEGKLFIQIPTDVVEYPFEVIDAVVVNGLSLIQAEELVRETFSRYFKDVIVKLSLIEPGLFTVSVVGEVVRPGVYQATSLTRVSEVLDMAELKGNASKSGVEVLRGSESIVVDICRYEIEGDLRDNPILRSGDVVLVPEMESSVIVRGAVYGHGARTQLPGAKEPAGEERKSTEGTYELLPGERVSDMIKKAGGTTPRADLRNAYLDRFDPDTKGTTRMALNLEEILSERGGESDIAMRNGDVLVVPSREEKIYVTGAVSNPGGFDYQSTLSVTDYIGLAGGPSFRAHVRRVQILRADGSRITVPYGTRSTLLLRGDTIMVPEVTLKWWQDYVTILTAVSSVVISWLVIAK